MGETVSLTKRVSFSAMHELRSPTLSEAENRRIFGKCFNTHGHDYFLEVTVQGSVDENGKCCDRDKFEDALNAEIVTRFNGTHLNHIFPNTTGEILVQEFFKLLKAKLTFVALVSVRLQETPRNYFNYPEII